MFTEIQFKGYKLFDGEKHIRFDKITNLNVIIGKNNSGKSSLLDVIEMAYDDNSFEKQKRQIDSIRVKIPMTKDMVQRIFSPFSRTNEWEAARYWNQVEGKSALIEFGGTKDSKNPSGYWAVNTGNIPMENESCFQSGLYDFEREKKTIFLDAYQRKEILSLKRKAIWNFPVQEREPVIWSECF